MYNSPIIQLLLAIAILVLSYSAYRLFLSERMAQKLNLTSGSPKLIFFQRISGFILFGCVPLVIVLYSGHGLNSFGVSSPVSGTYMWTLIFSAIIIPLNFINARTAENLEVYPQIRKDVWSLQLISLSALSWIGYLTAYEFLFRGFLLFSTIPLLGIWPAIGLNVVLYSLAHLHKGSKEMLGAVPLGFVVCYLTYITGSFWVALFIHLVLALSNEWFSIYRNPSMVIKLAWK